MGKRIIQQRRGRGTSTYKAVSFKFKGKPGHRVYDNIEKEGLIKGKVIDLIHCAGHSAPLAKVLFENGLCLPSGSNLSNNDQDRIIGIIKDCI